MGELVACEVLEPIAESFDERVGLFRIGAAVTVQSKGVKELIQILKGILFNVSDAQLEKTIKQVPVHKRVFDARLDSVLCRGLEVASKDFRCQIDLRASEDQRGQGEKAFDYRRVLFSTVIVPHLRQDSNGVFVSRLVLDDVLDSGDDSIVLDVILSHLFAQRLHKVFVEVKQLQKVFVRKRLILKLFLQS
jgi:hypothetical protein